MINLLPQSDSNQLCQIKTIGKYSYNLQHCIGQGAFGKVFKGEEQSTRKVVAIKQLDNQLLQNTYFRESIIREIQILKSFNHKNIVKFIDLINSQTSVYIITEFCQDKDLKYQIKNKRIDESQALYILKDIVNGFKELVKQNVIHRDLKPANILINENVYKIGDFGFAKCLKQKQLLQTRVGSPLYMAPQILEGKEYSQKSDIWSLGVIFHEMLNKKVPWIGTNESDLLLNIQSQPYQIKDNNNQLQPISKEILIRTLVYEENNRIAWNELFDILDNNNLIGEDLQNKENQTPNTGGHILNVIKPTIEQKPVTPVYIQAQRVILNDKRQNTSKQNEVNRIFTTINNIREYIAFRHFVCIDLFEKIKKNTAQMNNQQLNYEKFILCIAASVKIDIQQLIQILNKEMMNKDVFQNSKELQALASTIRKEKDFSFNFIDEFLQVINNSKVAELLKYDKDVSFIFQNQINNFSEQDRIKMEDYIYILGNQIAYDILNNIKKVIGNKQSSQELEVFRQCIVSSEYILDTIHSKKQINNGQEVLFDLLHFQKSEHTCVKMHLDHALNKINLR